MRAIRTKNKRIVFKFNLVESRQVEECREVVYSRDGLTSKLELDMAPRLVESIRMAAEDLEAREEEAAVCKRIQTQWCGRVTCYNHSKHKTHGRCCTTAYGYERCDMWGKGREKQV